MRCKLCNRDKLPNEFPPENVTDECFHPGFACLRCTIRSVKEKSCCPHPKCDRSASLDDTKVKWFQSILDHMFREYVADDVLEFTPDISGADTVTVTVLTGECMHANYSPSMTIYQLKEQIKMEMKHDPAKQKLLYNEKELLDTMPDGRLAKLSDYNVKPNSVLILVVVMFAVPDVFDHVVFDLYWGFPSTGLDFLDASCLMFQGKNFRKVVDWRRRSADAVKHSGDVIDGVNEIGHHTINVRLKNIPSSVTHLFFTLSAWSSPNISRYRNPSLKFYEADTPNKDLCKTTFTHAGHSRAVIMCSVSRDASGKWKIFESGKLSAGNAGDYDPIVSTIRSLISQGF